MTNKTTRYAHLTPRGPAALALSAVLAMPATGYAAAQQTGEQGSPPAEQTQQASRQAGSHVRQLEIFKLEHRQPKEIEQIITMAEGKSAADQTGGYPGVVPGAASPVHHEDDRLLTATNADQRVLFVRGSDEQIRRVQALVKAFDVPNEKLARHSYGDVRLLLVPNGVSSTLAELNLQGETMQAGDMQLLIFRDASNDDERVRQAEKVLQEMNGNGGDGDGAKQNETRKPQPND